MARAVLALIAHAMIPEAIIKRSRTTIANRSLVTARLPPSIDALRKVHSTILILALTNHWGSWVPSFRIGLGFCQ
jgi:hypothetical protein